MQIGKMIFQPLVTLVFTRVDVEHLMRLSAEHYDGTCRRLSECGGAIFGMMNELTMLDKAEVGRVMNFGDIDVLAKVTIARDIHSKLAAALGLINKGYEQDQGSVATLSAMRQVLLNESKNVLGTQYAEWATGLQRAVSLLEAELEKD
jgi:hypothetical protein